jgi:hypothetical protein
MRTYVVVSALCSSLLCSSLCVPFLTEDMQQRTQQEGAQHTNYNTHSHPMDLHIESSCFLIRYILTPDDGHVGQNML